VHKTKVYLVPTNPQEDRIKIVDLLRTISILAVLANHFFSINFSPSSQAGGVAEQFFRPLYMRFALSGAYGVSIFFVLSGFLITRMTASRNSNIYLVSRRQFYIRRAARILPLLILIFSFVLIVNVSCALVPDGNVPQQLSIIFSPDMHKFDWKFFLCCFTLTLNWLYIFTSYNYGMQLGILWSIAVEEQFYLLFPLWLRTAGNYKRFTSLLIILIILGPIARYLGNFYEGPKFTASFTNSFASFDLISLGVLLFFTEQKCRNFLSRSKSISVALCTFGTILVTATYFATTTGDPTNRIYGPSVLGVGVFLCLLGGLQIKEFESIPKPITMIGELSYGLYLYHPLVLFLLWPILLGKSALLGFFLFVTTSVFLGWASLRYFEHPVNRLIRKRFL